MPTKHLPCEICGKDSLVEVTGDGFDDAPPSFTITRTCSGGCQKRYASLTPAEMTELTGLPKAGWPNP